MLEPLNKASVSAERARCLLSAIYDLTSADDCFSVDFLDRTKPQHTEHLLRVYGLLRTHDTAAGLLRIMLDELDSLTANLDELERAEIQSPKSTPPKKCADTHILQSSRGARHEK